jgi:two-component system sensor histidine kinase PhoQ
LSCILQLPEDITLRADEGDLFELFGNLLENAYKHCRTQVRVSAEIQDTNLQIAIEDDGPGIAAAEVSRLLKRGERADQAHPGEGIGLAVASEVVSQYAGSLHVGVSALGGTDVRIQMPDGQTGD